MLSNTVIVIILKRNLKYFKMLRFCLIHSFTFLTSLQQLLNPAVTSVTVQKHKLHALGTGVPAKTGVPDQVTGWEIIREMLTYIWPKDERGIKIRVLTALSLLIGAKVTIVVLFMI